MTISCSDVCEAVAMKMCHGGRCKYADICNDEMDEYETHEQMIECVANGFKAPDKPEQDTVKDIHTGKRMKL